MPNRSQQRSQLKPDALLALAAKQLAAGEGLAAQRTARAAEQLLALEAKLKRREQAYAAMQQRLQQTAKEIDSRLRDIEVREAALIQRETDLDVESRRLDDLKRQLETLYAQMYNKRPDE